MFCFLSVHDFVINVKGYMLQLSNERQEAFVDNVVKGLDLDLAAKLAGYTENKGRFDTYRLMRTPAIMAAVQIGVARSLALDAPVARKVLHDIMVDATADKRLRVACAKDLLNRAGHIAPKAVAAGAQGVIGLNEMNMHQLRELADKLEGEIAGRAKEVSSATKAPNDTQAIDDII